MVFEETVGKWTTYEGKTGIYKLKNRPQHFDKKKEEISEEWINFLVNDFSNCSFEMGISWVPFYSCNYAN